VEHRLRQFYLAWLTYEDRYGISFGDYFRLIFWTT